MSNLTDLQTRRDAVTAEIAALDATKAGGLPDTRGTAIAVEHQAYKRGLYEELQFLNEQIAIYEGPSESATYGVV